MLDLFCGLGGASVAFREAGWEVIGVDIEPKFKPEIVADLTTWHWDGGPVDLVWASPPCQEFSTARRPRIYNPSMALVEASRRIIREVNPTWWVIENVRGAVRFLGPNYQTAGAFYLWSNLPPLGDFPWPIGWKGGRGHAKSMTHNVALRALVPRAISDRLLYAITHQMRLT
jgi:hypothetical protein